MTEIRELLDQLDQAHAAGTPGPWLAGAVDGAVAVKRSTAEYGSHDGSTFALLLPGPEVWNPTEALANARLCSDMHNALPRLTAALRAVLDLADELELQAELVCASSPHACEAYGAAADRLRAAAPSPATTTSEGNETR